MLLKLLRAGIRGIRESLVTENQSVIPFLFINRYNLAMVEENILIIEDDLDTRIYLQFLLGKKYGITCVSTLEFNDGKNIPSKYDIILLDISIKNKVNGFNLIKKIKKDHSYGNLPLICLSAQNSDQEKEMAISGGADDLLTKPVSNNKILEVISMHLSEKRKLNP